jgi:hypothetical protein
MGSHVRAWVVMGCMLATAACGGRVSGDGGDGGGATADAPAAAAGDGGPVAFPICPAEPPAAGTACFMPHQGCIYFPGGVCRSFLCDDSAHWQSTTEGC